jgi:hypothetical protein
MIRRDRPIHLLLVLLIGAVPACPDASTTIISPDAVPAVALLDVNPDSDSFDRSVSPRHHLGHVTAWYFGSAT